MLTVWPGPGAPPVEAKPAAVVAQADRSVAAPAPVQAGGRPRRAASGQQARRAPAGPGRDAVERGPAVRSQRGRPEALEPHPARTRAPSRAQPPRGRAPRLAQFRSSFAAEPWQSAAPSMVLPPPPPRSVPRPPRLRRRSGRPAPAAPARAASASAAPAGTPPPAPALTEPEGIRLPTTFTPAAQRVSLHRRPRLPCLHRDDGDRRHPGRAHRRGVAQRRRAGDHLGGGAGRQRGAEGRAGHVQGRAGGAALSAAAPRRPGDARPGVQGHAVHPRGLGHLPPAERRGLVRLHPVRADRRAPSVPLRGRALGEDSLGGHSPGADRAHRGVQHPRGERDGRRRGVQGGPLPPDAPSALVSGGVRRGAVRDDAGPARGEEAGPGPHHRPAGTRVRDGVGRPGHAGDPRGPRGLLRHGVPVREARRAGHPLHRAVRGHGERGTGHLLREPGPHPARARSTWSGAGRTPRWRRTSSLTSGSGTWSPPHGGTTSG